MLLLSSWLAEQEVLGSIPGLVATISEIGFLLLPSLEIPLKQHKSTIQPTSVFKSLCRAGARLNFDDFIHLKCQYIPVVCKSGKESVPVPPDPRFAGVPLIAARSSHIQTSPFAHGKGAFQQVWIPLNGHIQLLCILLNAKLRQPPNILTEVLLTEVLFLTGLQSKSGLWIGENRRSVRPASTICV